MSQIITQNPGSSEIQSPLIAGLTEGLNKISSVLNLKTGTLEDVKLTAIAIDNDEKNKNRIFEANFGNRLWLSTPPPVIKKNGVVISQSESSFSIDYIGGSITFSSESKPSDSDTITVSATYIIAESESLELINSALSAVQTQSNKYKGNYDNLGALQLSYPSAQNGDYAIVFEPLAVYAWKNDGWYDTRSIEDLSDYYNKGETDNLLNQKEPTIQQKGSTSSDDDYYWGGRKTWQDLKEKVRLTVLAGLSTASDNVVNATDTILSAIGKLQAQVSKSTQRAYLSGTGAPSTSTVGDVGQRYINTSNGDEYTCVEVSGDTYTWEIKPKSVNGKTPDSPGGDITLVASDVGAVPKTGGSFSGPVSVNGNFSAQNLTVSGNSKLGLTRFFSPSYPNLGLTAVGDADGGIYLGVCDADGAYKTFGVNAKLNAAGKVSVRYKGGGGESSGSSCRFAFGSKVLTPAAGSYAATLFTSASLNTLFNTSGEAFSHYNTAVFGVNADYKYNDLRFFIACGTDTDADTWVIRGPSTSQTLPNKPLRVNYLVVTWL